VEDHSWYSLTEVVLNLLGMTVRDNDEDCPSTASPTSAWEALLQSDYHAAFCAGEGRLLFGDDIELSPVVVDSKKRNACGPSCDITLLSSLVYVKQFVTEAKERVKHDERHVITIPELYKQLIFDSLHLLHEDSRLVSASRGFQWTRRIGTLLLYVSEQMSPLMIDYEDHFHRLLGNSRCLSNACDSYLVHSESKSRVSSFIFPPCIMTYLDSILQSDGDEISVEDAYGVAEYDSLFETGLNGVCSTTWLVLRLFTSLFCRNVDAGFDRTHRDRVTILAMLDEGILRPSQLQDELPMGVVLPLLEAIRRCFLDPPQVESTVDCWPTAAFNLVGRNDLATFMAQSMLGSSSSTRREDCDGGSPEVSDPDNDGLVGLEHYSSMIFPDDNRVREAVRLLRSSRPLFLRVVRQVELSDHEYERSKQDKLLLLCRRSIALPLGRGMLTLGTHHAPTAEQLLIPSIVMAGRVPPMNGTLALDMSTCPSNYRVWPEFHNGVAAGLRLPHASEDMNYKAITRTWIKFNKPVHAVENVAGATGANSAQTTTPSYAHGGFLMALGLRGYLSALTTIDLTDYLTQGTITTTVGLFLGMSACKRGSCDPSISKMLCLHVPSLLPPSFLPMDLASPVQAASVASIGLLYQSSSHRLMTEFLLNEMGRQPTKDQNSNDRESFALVCGLALGMVNLKGGTSTVSGLEDLRIEERLQCYITGSVNRGEFNGRHENVDRSAGSGNQGEMDWNSRIDEVTYSINTDITASGATLALGLMYIRSQNASVAASLQLPDTHFLLDYCRPDMLALRVISRSLILWNDITPTSNWIELQIPSIVKSSINLMKNAAKRAMNIAAGGDVMDEQGDTGDDEEVKKDMIDFDPHAIRQANAYIISGACFALGLKYAGSGNRAAAAAIIERVLWFLELRDNKDVVSLTQRPDNSTLVTCLCTAAISLAMVMSGTGDLDSFRLFRALRWKCDDATLYGTHMAFGAAIGLLFLGGGKCTLGSSPEDVAVLLAAFYPHFPILSSDNQYHLQALRHLYVLAVHERILEACDVDTNQKICIPIEQSVKDSSEVINTSMPYLVANDSNFTRLRSKSERYYPIDINVQDWSNCGNVSTLFFKRKAGHLSYLQDPNGLRSLSMQQVGIADNKSLLNSIKMFSGDAKLTAFAKYFCTSSFVDNKSFERRCSNIAYEILKEGKSSDILALYMRIFGLIGQRKIDVEDVISAKLLRTYVETRHCLGNDSTAASNLINREVLSQLFEGIDDLFRDVDSTLLLSFTQGDPTKWWVGDNRYLFSIFLAWNGVPLLKR
jgi:anaphase-promoting complex subunit 1